MNFFLNFYTMNENPSANAATDKSAKQSNASTPKYRTSLRILWGIYAIGVLVILGFIIYVSQSLPSFEDIENPQSDLSTQIISEDGVVMQTLYTRENRTNVRLDEISPYVIDALVATEDVRFYNHSGVDPKSFAGIIADLFRSREIRGGSTITMQLARNLYRQEVGQSNKYIRKIKEYFVSAFIERRFTKEEIITAYLNTVNIYGTSYGIETTSKRLFGKRAKDLSIEESALIVGMLKGQGMYNPYRYADRTMQRRNTVINQMIKYGVLNNTRYNADSIKQIPMKLAPQGYDHLSGVAPYFRDHIREKLKVWCKEHGYNLYTDGLRIYTTIDSRMQKYAEQAVKEHLSQLQNTFEKHLKSNNPLKKTPAILTDLMKQSDRFRKGRAAGKSIGQIEEEFKKPVAMRIFSWKGFKDTTLSPWDSLAHFAKFLETGMAAIDPTNGHVKAWVGGINYEQFQYDHVALGTRQVGSTFKPFVYAAAIDNGKNPCDKIINQPVVFPNPGGKPWSPKNSDGKIGGYMTLRTGLATSTNLITAQLMDQVGPQTVVDYAHKLGIKSKLEPVPALCLGTADLNVLELTSAYGTFANMGKWIEPVTITRIEDRYGNVIQEFVPETRVALSKEKAYLMVDLLKGVVDQKVGTAHRLRWNYKFENEIGGKTGTTQGQADGWFVGITPNLVSGVWVGCSDRRMSFSSLQYGQGANMALPIWALFMKKVYADNAIGLPKDGFAKPEGMAELLSCEATIGTPSKPKRNNELEDF